MLARYPPAAADKNAATSLWGKVITECVYVFINSEVWDQSVLERLLGDFPGAGGG